MSPRRTAWRASAAPLLAGLALTATPAIASARVSASATSTLLTVEGTALGDDIVVKKSGVDLVVSDKDKVGTGSGCRKSGDVALCASHKVDPEGRPKTTLATRRAKEVRR